MSIPTRRPGISARRQETRTRIVHAGLAVIAEHGVAFTVEQVCEVAGFTRGAFYSNFESKDELCAAILREHADAALEAARGAIDDPAGDAARPIGQAVEDAVESFFALQHSDERWPTVAAELRLHAVRSPEFRAVYRVMRDEIRARITHLFTATLVARGLTVPIGIDRAVELMEAVHDHASLEARVTDEAVDRRVMTNLTDLLTSLIQKA